VGLPRLVSWCGVVGVGVCGDGVVGDDDGHLYRAGNPCYSSMLSGGGVAVCGQVWPGLLSVSTTRKQQ